MKIIAFLTTLIGLLFAIFKLYREKTDLKKHKIRTGVNEVLEGIEAKDASKVTAGFDTINGA